MPSAECKQDRQHRSVRDGPLDIRLYAPVIVKYTGGRAQVNQAMKHLPPAAAESSDPFSCRRDCKRHEQQETDEARDNERPLQKHVLEDLCKVEILIQPHIRRKMDESVKETEQSEHPAKPDHTAPSGNPPKRSYCQGDHQETQCPDACPVSDVLEGIGTQATGKRIEEEPHCREKTG